MNDVGNERGCACVGAGGIWEISESQFCRKPKTALKIKVFFLKKGYIGKLFLFCYKIIRGKRERVREGGR